GLRRYGNVADRSAEAQPGECDVPRFVVLEHDWPAVHWDLLLECGPVLRAWRLLAEPGPGRTVPAEPNYDHRLLYLDYEGPLLGDRGRVRRWDAGTYEGELADGWEVRLTGTRLNGPARMTRTASGWEFVS
ncbi:MAG TPA: DNA polymerase ligase N-terminal domain-containing protein, partial [Fimbriiglobus sp.]|nr:DNA polymerase ligase N-terminal domain-containing protein [Fimbriiglobus sp.]